MARGHVVPLSNRLVRHAKVLGQGCDATGPHKDALKRRFAFMSIAHAAFKHDFKRTSRAAPQYNQLNLEYAVVMIDDLHDLSQRLKVARSRAGLTLEALGLALGVSPQAVHQWEAGKTWPANHRLSDVARVTGVTVEWLLTGSRAVDPLQPESGGHTPRNEGRRLPKLSQSQAIGPEPWAIRDGPSVAAHFPCGPRSFAIVIEDRSNEPVFSVGDSVIVDPDLAPQPGDMVLVRLPHGLPVFRRYRPQPDNRASLVAHSADWAELTIQADGSDQSVIVGTMAEHARPRRP